MNLGTFRGFTVAMLPEGATYPKLETRFYDGTGRNFNVTDVNKVVTTRNASSITLTLPQLIVEDCACIHIKQQGAGQITFVAGTGVTIDVASTVKKTRAQYSIVTLMRQLNSSSRTGQIWTLFGDFASS